MTVKTWLTPVCWVALTFPAVGAEESGQQEEVMTIRGTNDQTEMDTETQKLFKTPGAAGDPLAALEALPGVIMDSERGGGPAVRGSAPEDNTYLVDGLPVGYLFHYMGYSIFDDDVIRSFELKTGAFEAEHGESTGAVLDVELREPRNKPIGGTVSLSFLNAGGIVEGRVTEDQSFYASFRRSTLSFFGPMITEGQDEDPDDGIIIDKFPDSQDYFGVYHWKVNDNHKLTARVLGAYDEVGIELTDRADEVVRDPALEGEINGRQAFNSGAINWAFTANNGTALDSTVGFLNTEYKQQVGTTNRVEAEINDIYLKSSASTYLDSHNLFEVGGQIRESKMPYDLDLLFVPCDRTQPDCRLSDGVRIQSDDDLLVHFYQAYVKNAWDMSFNTKLIAGAHLSTDDYIEEDLVEPRIKLEHRTASDYLVFLAYGQHHRFPDIDTVVKDIGNPDLKNPKADHYVAGLDVETLSGYRMKTEVYYKDLYDLVLVSGDDDIYNNEGEGEAYGLEILLEKQPFDRWSGWLSIGLSKSKRTNNVDGEIQDFQLDRPVVISLVANYDLTDRWTSGIKFSYQSGPLDTPIEGGVEDPNFPGYYVPVYGDVYSERLPDIYNLDVRFEYDNGKGYRFFVDILEVVDTGNVSYEYSDDYSSRELKEDDGLSRYPIPILGVAWDF